MSNFEREFTSSPVFTCQTSTMNVRTMRKICSELLMKTLEGGQYIYWSLFFKPEACIFVKKRDFETVVDVFLVYLMLTLSRFHTSFGCYHIKL